MASSSEDESDWVVLPTDREPSDGDSSFWPTEARWAMPDDSGWRVALANMWLEETGAHEKNVPYIIRSLPEGYGLFDRARTTNNIRDPFIFGHPSGRYFQSRVTFFPHFYWLMTGREGDCKCKNCEYQREGKILKRRKRGNSAGPELRNTRSIGDEEAGNVFKSCVTRLKARRTYDEPIKGPQNNMDWRLTHGALENLFMRLTLQAAFVPRRGETVLWTPSLEGVLEWNPNTKSVQMRNEKGKWMGVPEWRAGIVTQVPKEEILIQDMVETSAKKGDVTYSGFRVETLPDPLNANKSLSLHVNYVPLKCVKPFNAWDVFLQSIPRKELHPSIENALTTMASWSLVSGYRFQGEWPRASIYCKGIYIGAELLARKDAVRLKPKNYELRYPPTAKRYAQKIIDVLVIESIRLQLDDCIDDPDSKEYAESYSAKIDGHLYRLNNKREENDPYAAYPLERMTDDEVFKAFQQGGMIGYGQWHRFKGMKHVTVSPEGILGRCYEPDANVLLWGDRRLGHDLNSVLGGREFSRQVDARIPECKRWFWGDNRAETLGLATVDGVDVGPAAEQRNTPKKWRALFRIIDGPAGPVDHRDAGIPSEGAGRPPKSQSAFSGVKQISKLVSTGLGEVSEDASSEEEESEREEIGYEEEEDDIRKEEGGDNRDEGPVEESDEHNRREDYQVEEKEVKVKAGGAEPDSEEDDEDDERWSCYNPAARKILKDLYKHQQPQLAGPELKPLSFYLNGRRSEEKSMRV